MNRFSFLLLLLFTASLQADAPVAGFLFPAGGQRGQTLPIHAGGLNLNAECAAEVNGNGVTLDPILKQIPTQCMEGPVLPLVQSQQQEDYPRTMLGTVKIAPDANLGTNYVRLRTSQGITEPLRFIVGDLPEILEKEIEGDPIPVAVPFPVTINGRIYPREDVDVWQIRLKKGEGITLLVAAQSLGSPLEAHLEILNTSGQRIAESDGKGDPRLRFTSPADGEYQIRIRDINSGGSLAHVYRLTLTPAPLIRTIFPLGGKRGEKLTLTADALPPIILAIPADAPKRWSVALPLANGASVPVNLATDDVAEVREGSPLKIPCVANGQIAKPEEIDDWSFTAKKGETLQFTLTAGPLGSPLFGLLTLTDAAGKVLATTEGGGGNSPADPELRFAVPVDGEYHLKVSDRFRSRGGLNFGYRLKVDQPKPDFTLSMLSPSLTIPRLGTVPVKLQLQRFGGFNGPVQVQIDGLPEGVTAKEVILAAGQNNIDLPIKVEAGAKIQTSAIRIRGTAWMQANPLNSVVVPVVHRAVFQPAADVPALEEIRLAVAIPTPFKILADFFMKSTPRGSVYLRHYRIERNGFTGPIEVGFADRQARHLQGVTGPKLTIAPGVSEFDYPVTLPPWMEIGRTCRVCVMGTANVKDTDQSEHTVTYSSREQNDQIIVVVEPEKIAIETETHSLRMIPGEATTLEFTLKRSAEFTEKATVEVILPQGHPGISVEAPPVPDGENKGRILLRCTPETSGPFVAPLVVRVSIRQGMNLAFAEVKVQLVRGDKPTR